MKLKKIKIEKYKNLNNIEVDFPDSNVVAFIGNNGSGKSNILEVLTEVFSLAKKHCEAKRYDIIVYPEVYGCEIKYENNGIDYILKYSKSDISIYKGEKKLAKKEITEALPESIIVYYAGETDRQARTANNTFDEKYDNRLKATDNNTFPGYKFMDYYSVNDLSLLLLTAAVYQGEYYRKLLDLLKCEKVLPKTSILLKNPKGKKSDEADTYWGATGFVGSFLNELRRSVSGTQDLSIKYLMTFSEIDEFKKTSKNEGEFFTKLKALRNAGYLDRVSIELQGQNSKPFDCEMLSEGEKQLALLYLLTSFTAQDSCLYILDEFDAYLHPNWQRLLSRLISDVNVLGQMLFATHSAATISGLRSENIFIIKEGEVKTANSETYNRSLDEIMEENMGISLRADEFKVLEIKFRDAVMHGQKRDAEAILAQIRMVISEEDPFFITAKIALSRMK